MRYFFYECQLHGRLSDNEYILDRNGIELRAICEKCSNHCQKKFIYVCKHHGELTEKDIRKNKKNYGRCAICHRMSANRKRNNNREEFNQKMAIDRKENPEKWDKIYKKQYQNKRENHKDLLSLIKVCSARKIKLEDYFLMLEKQENKCAICKKHETCIDGKSKDKKPRRLSIDHCHETNKVRGLLCHACNTALGKFKHDINLIKKAINYLKKHS